MKVGQARNLVESRIGRTGFSAALAFGLAAMFVLLPTSPSQAQSGNRVGVMPKVTPDQYVERGVSQVDQWLESQRSNVATRTDAFKAVKSLFSDYEKFRVDVNEIYPTDGLEWLLITDEVADTMAARLVPFLQSYSEKHEELLTKGRQAFELELMRIVGAPPRMLGFHVHILGGYAVEKADSLFAAGVTDDYDGLVDGALRNLRDWCHQWAQVHTTELMTYQSRLVQQDWIISRLKDRCGVAGSWTIKQQYMAMIQADSTKGLSEDRFAHEFHLISEECENEERVIMIDLPNFMAMQNEVMELSNTGK